LGGPKKTPQKNPLVLNPHKKVEVVEEKLSLPKKMGPPTKKFWGKGPLVLERGPLGKNNWKWKRPFPFF